MKGPGLLTYPAPTQSGSAEGLSKALPEWVSFVTGEISYLYPLMLAMPFYGPCGPL